MALWCIPRYCRRTKYEHCRFRRPGSALEVAHASLQNDPWEGTEMTNRFGEASLGRDASDTPPPVEAGSGASRSIRKASVVAGLGLLLLSALAGFGDLVVVNGLVTKGDAAKTAEDIMASEGMFRL